MQFLNPALLAGTLLFAVPLLIHLLNKQRHKRRPWAAMDFLLRAFQKQRNRLRNENLLLLLLRCLIPILLALAVARPLLEAATSLITGGGVVHHVFILDASYSMGLSQDGAQSPYERGRVMIDRALDRFERNPNRNDKVTLVRAGVRTRFLVREDLDIRSAKAAWLEASKPDDASSGLDDAVSQVVDAVAETEDALTQVYVLTDLQMRSLGDAIATPDGDAAPALDDTLRDLFDQLRSRGGLQLHLIDTGPMSSGRGGTLDNVQITDLRLTDPAAVVKTPSEVIATLTNRGSAAATCEVKLEVDGGEPIRKVVEVPAGAEAEADFQLTFRTRGRRRVRAALMPDALIADDERYLTVDVRDRIRILLVDGRDGGDPLKSYAYLWKAMLDPDENVLPTFAVEVVDIVSLLGGQCTPKDYDVVVLADIERLNNRAAIALQDALRGGSGVLCQFGSQCEADSFNLHLFAAGDGPMPFRLLSPQGGAPGSSTVRSPSITDAEHPLLQEFEEDIYREILQAIPMWRWHGISADSLQEGATVPVRVTDAEQTPLFVSRPFGEGQALFLTSPIGSEYDADRWNRLDDPLVAFPLLHGIVKWLALPATDPFSVTVGAGISCSLDARPIEVEVSRPERDGRPRTPLAEGARPLPGGRFALPLFTDTRFAGFYEFNFSLDRESGREPEQLPFAVNVDPAEGDLRYPTHAEVQTALGVERVLETMPVVAEASEGSDRSDLGPSLLLITLLLVLGEAALARYVAARRT